LNIIFFAWLAERDKHNEFKLELNIALFARRIHHVLKIYHSIDNPIKYAGDANRCNLESIQIGAEKGHFFDATAKIFR
jgi:hypothetical protein